MHSSLHGAAPMGRQVRVGTVFVLALLAVVWVAAPAAFANLGKYHEDERIGFKIRPPRDWEQTAQAANEKWIVAKYVCDRTYTFNDPVSGTMDHRPDMTAITFIDAVLAKRGVDTTEEDDGSVTIEFNNPYKDYQDFMRRTYSDGGWFVSAEEEGEVKGVPVTKLEIKVEKLTYTGPKRVVTWIYHLEGVDLAVQYEVLENHYDKLKGMLESSLESLRVIPRTKALVPETTGEKIKFEDESKLTPDERKKRRADKERISHEKGKSSLPDDWCSEEMGRFLVLLHTDRKYAKDVVEQAEAVWSWLDKTFPYFGAGEYVPSPIIRMCKDQVEEQAFFSGTSWGDFTEIVTHRDVNAGAGSWEFEYVNGRMAGIWFHYRNGDAWAAAPGWLSRGFDQVIGGARAKGRGLEFKIDDWERDGLRESVRNGELTSPRDLVMLTRETFYDNPHRVKQSAAFIRYLLTSKSKKTRDILHRYFKALQDVMAEVKAEEEKRDAAARTSAGDAPKTEEEEEKRMKERIEGYKKREKEFLDKLYQSAFGDFDDKDWKRLEDDFVKSL